MDRSKSALISHANSAGADRSSIFGRLALYLAFLGIALWTALCAITALVCVPFSARAGHHIHRWWGRGFCALLDIRIHYTIDPAHPREGGGIYASNHASLFDIPVFSSLPLEFRWVSKAEVGRIPLMGRAMRRLGCYFLQRDRSSTDLNTMKMVETDLRQGIRIMIFPEGTRTRTGELLPFKRGAFRTAVGAGVPIFPMVIVGSFQIAPAGKFPRRRGHQVSVHIGAPLYPSTEVPAERAIPELAQRYSQAIHALLSQH